MRCLVTALLLLVCLPLFAQPGGEKEKKPIKVATLLDTIPTDLLSPKGDWSQDDLLEVNRHLKNVGSGHKVILHLQFDSMTAKDKYVMVFGTLKLTEYTKFAFRGRDIQLRPFIHLQAYLALPLEDKAVLQKVQRGETLKLLATTAQFSLEKLNADVFFNGDLNKTVLLQVIPTAP